MFILTSYKVFCINVDLKLNMTIFVIHKVLIDWYDSSQPNIVYTVICRLSTHFEHEPLVRT